MLHNSSRSITPRLAPIVAALELREATIVSAEDIATIAGVPAKSARVRSLIHRLVGARWLAPLHVRGQYEFLPGRAGAYSRNDALDPLRALAKSGDLPVQVALSGAAFLRGFSDRAPVEFDILVPHGRPVSSALRSAYHVHFINPARLFGAADLLGVDVSTRERLLVDVALWPQTVGRSLALRDHWLGNALREASAGEIVSMLRRLGSARATARAGYLAERFGRPDIADQVGYLGRSSVAVPLLPNSTTGQRDLRFNVIDSVGAGSRS
jgi:predicted transcriptional regulator of viral defense system